ncbi:MAG: hypothetical protein ABIY52_13805 [Gemmatimonadaceae bacterium]
MGEGYVAPMISDTNEAAMSVTARDLTTISHLLKMRFASTTAEARRTARMRSLVSIAAELTIALRTYSRHALVHCQGTAGTSDLEADTESVIHALRAFSTEIARAANEYEHASAGVQS